MTTFLERECYDDMLPVRANYGGSAALLVGIVKGDGCDVLHLCAMLRHLTKRR